MKFMSKFLTKKGLEDLKKELDYLKKIKRKEIARRIKQAVAQGDLSENAAYHEAKDAQAFLEGKILELQKTIKEAKVVSKRGNGWVQIGSKVIVSSHNNRKEKFQVVGSVEADSLNGKISVNSPLGRALLNKPKGVTVKVETPNGEVKYKILKIE